MKVCWCVCAYSFLQIPSFLMRGRHTLLGFGLMCFHVAGLVVGSSSPSPSSLRVVPPSSGSVDVQIKLCCKVRSL